MFEDQSFWQHNRVYMFYLKLSHAIFLWHHCVLVTANHTSHTHTETLAPVSSIIIIESWFFGGISTTLTFAEIDPIWPTKKHLGCESPHSHPTPSVRCQVLRASFPSSNTLEKAFWTVSWKVRCLMEPRLNGGLEPQLETNSEKKKGFTRFSR